jgi:hypothetical protein
MVRAAEERFLPAVPVAAGKGGEPAVGDASLELAAVDALGVEGRGDRTPVGEQAVRVEVEGEPAVLADRRDQPLRPVGHTRARERAMDGGQGGEAVARRDRTDVPDRRALCGSEGRTLGGSEGRVDGGRTGGGVHGHESFLGTGRYAPRFPSPPGQGGECGGWDRCWRRDGRPVAPGPLRPGAG